MIRRLLLLLLIHTATGRLSTSSDSFGIPNSAPRNAGAAFVDQSQQPRLRTSSDDVTESEELPKEKIPDRAPGWNLHVGTQSEHRLSIQNLGQSDEVLRQFWKGGNGGSPYSTSAPITSTESVQKWRQNRLVQPRSQRKRKDVRDQESAESQWTNFEIPKKIAKKMDFQRFGIQCLVPSEESEGLANGTARREDSPESEEVDEMTRAEGVKSVNNNRLEPSGYTGGNEGNNLQDWQKLQPDGEMFPEGYDGLSALPRTLVNEAVSAEPEPSVVVAPRHVVREVTTVPTSTSELTTTPSLSIIFTVRPPVAPPVFLNSMNTGKEEEGEEDNLIQELESAVITQRPEPKETPEPPSGKRSIPYAIPRPIDNMANQSKNTRIQCVPCPGGIFGPPMTPAPELPPLIVPAESYAPEGNSEGYVLPPQPPLAPLPAPETEDSALEKSESAEMIEVAATDSATEKSGNQFPDSAQYINAENSEVVGPTLSPEDPDLPSSLYAGEMQSSGYVQPPTAVAPAPAPVRPMPTEAEYAPLPPGPAPKKTAYMAPTAPKSEYSAPPPAPKSEYTPAPAPEPKKSEYSAPPPAPTTSKSEYSAPPSPSPAPAPKLEYSQAPPALKTEYSPPPSPPTPKPAEYAPAPAPIAPKSEYSQPPPSPQKPAEYAPPPAPKSEYALPPASKSEYAPPPASSTTVPPPPAPRKPEYVPPPPPPAPKSEYSAPPPPPKSEYSPPPPAPAKPEYVPPPPPPAPKKPEYAAPPPAPKKPEYTAPPPAPKKTEYAAPPPAPTDEIENIGVVEAPEDEDYSQVGDQEEEYAPEPAPTSYPAAPAPAPHVPGVVPHELPSPAKGAYVTDHGSITSEESGYEESHSAYSTATSKPKYQSLPPTAPASVESSTEDMAVETSVSGSFQPSRPAPPPPPPPPPAPAPAPPPPPEPAPAPAPPTEPEPEIVEPTTSAPAEEEEEESSKIDEEDVHEATFAVRPTLPPYIEVPEEPPFVDAYPGESSYASLEGDHYSTGGLVATVQSTAGGGGYAHGPVEVEPASYAAPTPVIPYIQRPPPQPSYQLPPSQPQGYQLPPTYSFQPQGYAQPPPPAPAYVQPPPTYQPPNNCCGGQLFSPQGNLCMPLNFNPCRPQAPSCGGGCGAPSPCQSQGCSSGCQQSCCQSSSCCQPPQPMTSSCCNQVVSTCCQPRQMPCCNQQVQTCCPPPPPPSCCCPCCPSPSSLCRGKRL
ncbi:unnamed protein product [Caenorhabditis auriculariae]|uniref:Uncharacterized protein n=1 Tax=Caenorhabditis auriculariae TaxID=2777116 RepID=A0A8S1HIA9_9PELO|nr:unnamed protein product [Caenorhabditis auriculariae]